MKTNLNWNKVQEICFSRELLAFSRQQMIAQLLVLFSENYVYNYTTITVIKRLFSFVDQGMDREIEKKICSKRRKRVCRGVRKAYIKMLIFNEVNRKEKN